MTIDVSKYENDELYPDGIHFQAPNCLYNENNTFRHDDSGKRVRIAVFDLDGTAIATSTPLRLMLKLNSEGRLKKRTIFMLASWGIAYKLHLPRKNNPVRERAFSAFKGKSAVEINKYMADFFENDIKKYIRHDAINKMEEAKDEGKCVILLSASFDGVVGQALLHFPAHFGISTQMKINDDGTYDNTVFGTAPEGHDKPVCLKMLADEIFGIGGWEVEDCYADHYSDMDVLAMANNPVAVTPDRRLERYAKEHSIKIEYWK